MPQVCQTEDASPLEGVQLMGMLSFFVSGLLQWPWKADLGACQEVRHRFGLVFCGLLCAKSRLCLRIADLALSSETEERPGRGRGSAVWTAYEKN